MNTFDCRLIRNYVGCNATVLSPCSAAFFCADTVSFRQIAPYLESELVFSFAADDFV